LKLQILNISGTDYSFQKYDEIEKPIKVRFAIAEQILV
jgi:hypothetical protein